MEGNFGSLGVPECVRRRHEPGPQQDVMQRASSLTMLHAPAHLPEAPAWYRVGVRASLLLGAWHLWPEVCRSEALGPSLSAGLNNVHTGLRFAGIFTAVGQLVGLLGAATTKLFRRRSYSVRQGHTGSLLAPVPTHGGQGLCMWLLSLKRSCSQPCLGPWHQHAPPPGRGGLCS